MHNLITNFDQIIDFAERMQVPVERRRGILREYLQAKFIATLYSLPNSKKLSFVGGTSLRLLRNLNRFSEDLDFDNLGLSNDEIADLVKEVVRRFQTEGLIVELKAQIKEAKTYFDIKFPSLLKELNLTANPKEKLMIKFDYADYWKGQDKEVMLLNKYGLIENVVVNGLNQVMAQKLTAYVQRNITQPRDVYDIVWLYSQGARIDRTFALKNGVPNIVQEAQGRYSSEGSPKGFKNRLQPFLFNPEELKKLDLFENVLKDLRDDQSLA
ncbi:MAG: nucleotidyl transferase AbiEii/AbiGii toxin family protein [bacterium]